MASRSLWTGSITFGLVNIPVKLFVAVREKNIQFHMLHDQDHVRAAAEDGLPERMARRCTPSTR